MSLIYNINLHYYSWPLCGTAEFLLYIKANSLSQDPLPHCSPWSPRLSPSSPPTFLLNPAAHPAPGTSYSSERERERQEKEERQLETLHMWSTDNNSPLLRQTQTSCIILRVAGVSGVYKIFPMSRGFSALQIIREIGLDSKFLIMLLQYGAEGTEKEKIKLSS